MALVERSQLTNHAEIFLKKNSNGLPLGENFYTRNTDFVRSCDTFNKEKTLRDIEVVWIPAAITNRGLIDTIIGSPKVYRL